jgi:hypothetical protein
VILLNSKGGDKPFDGVVGRASGFPLGGSAIDPKLDPADDKNNVTAVKIQNNRSLQSE